MKNEMKLEIRKQMLRTIGFTIFPLLIPLIFYIPDSALNKLGQSLIVGLLVIIDLYWVLKISKKDAVELFKHRNIGHENNKYQVSQKVLNRISNCMKIKGDFIRDETYKIHYDYKENVLLYNPHRYIERICDEVKSLISEITEIELEYISVSFIYQYPTYENDRLSGWQWITGKNSTSNTDLSEFIKQGDSYYHYLIVNDISTDFENDKGKLMAKHYRPSEKDSRYSEIGSISGYKMAFKNNNKTFCQGYLIISTYGRKFYSVVNKSKFYNSQDEFKEILFGLVLPSFRNLIETELGFLYMRHKYQHEATIEEIYKGNFI